VDFLRRGFFLCGHLPLKMAIPDDHVATLEPAEARTARLIGLVR